MTRKRRETRAPGTSRFRKLIARCWAASRRARYARAEALAMLSFRVAAPALRHPARRARSVWASGGSRSVTITRVRPCHAGMCAVIARTRGIVRPPGYVRRTGCNEPAADPAERSASAAAAQPKAARLADRRREAPADPPPLKHDCDRATNRLPPRRAGNQPGAPCLTPDELPDSSCDSRAAHRRGADDLSALEDCAGVVARNGQSRGERPPCERPARCACVALRDELQGHSVHGVVPQAVARVWRQVGARRREIQVSVDDGDARDDDHVESQASSVTEL